jgi:hypothetical protein
MRTLATCFVTSLGLTVGCSAKTVEPTAVAGAVALSTYRTTPARVIAVDELGKRTSTALRPDGTFVLSLAKVHKYKLAVGVGQSNVPVVFPRPSGRLDSTFVVKTNGALVHLGAVRYLAAAPPTGFKVDSVQLTTPAAASGDCVDCVHDDVTTSCADGEQGAEDSLGSTAAAANADQADAMQEMAVSDRNAPQEVSGCDAESGDQNEGEQEGEH